MALIAAAPFTPRPEQVPRLVDRERRRRRRHHPLRRLVAAARARPCAARPQPAGTSQQPFYLTGTLALQALVTLVAVVGWGVRFVRRGDDLARWLALGFTLMLFAALHLVFQPLLASSLVSQGDFLRMLAFVVFLVGAWRAIQFAEFGRAVAEERARVAREIHDGLAQYLFAVSTHASMLEAGAPVEEALPRLKEAAIARAAGGALRDPRALVRERHRAVRRGAPPLRRRPDGRRRARGRARGRPDDPPRARRADRDLPHRPGRPRERPQARERDAGRGDDRRSAPFGERFVTITRRRRRLRRRGGRRPARA